jgi:ABC-type Mn2+/Zn2+ transport system permease subunit
MIKRWRNWTFPGFWIAYQWDLPVGPTDVVLLGILYALGIAVKKLALLFRPKLPA